MVIKKNQTILLISALVLIIFGVWFKNKYDIVPLERNIDYLEKYNWSVEDKDSQSLELSEQVLFTMSEFKAKELIDSYSDNDYQQDYDALKNASVYSYRLTQHGIVDRNNLGLPTNLVAYVWSQNRTPIFGVIRHT